MGRDLRFRTYAKPRTAANGVNRNHICNQMERARGSLAHTLEAGHRFVHTIPYRPSTDDLRDWKTSGDGGLNVGAAVVHRQPGAVPISAMTTLDDVASLAANEHYLAVVSTLRADGTIQSSVVNAGFLAHPSTGRQTLAFVTYGRVKLSNLRARPQVTVTFRHGLQWATVEGHPELAGPDDSQPWLAHADQLRLLLRDIFSAAGGRHDDWEEYDRVMAEQRRNRRTDRSVRIYSNA